GGSERGGGSDRLGSERGSGRDSERGGSERGDSTRGESTRGSGRDSTRGGSDCGAFERDGADPFSFCGRSLARGRASIPSCARPRFSAPSLDPGLTTPRPRPSSLLGSGRATAPDGGTSTCDGLAVGCSPLA